MAIGYTGRTRRRWLFWTQYEYLSRAYICARWQTPWNVDQWPVLPFWTYQKPSS